MRPSGARAPSSASVLRRPCSPPSALPAKASLCGFRTVSPLCVSLGPQVSGSQHRWALPTAGGGTAWGRRDGTGGLRGLWGAATPRQPPLRVGDLDVPSELPRGYRDTSHSHIQTQHRDWFGIALPAGENHRLFFQLPFLLVC